MIFKISTLVPMLLCNKWHNACNLGALVIHIYHEENCCANMLASMDHFVHDSVWLSELPPTLSFHFFKGSHGLPYLQISLIWFFLV